MDANALRFSGSVIRLGDDVDTDAIYPAKYLNLAAIDDIASHCLENECPGFAALAAKNPIVVAGRNFGCGSSREHAPLAMKGCGVACVVAKSFARIFFRNAINIGLPIIELEEADGIAAGNTVEIDLSEGSVVDRTDGRRYSASPLPEFMRELLRGDGILPYIEKRLANIPPRGLPGRD